MTKRNRSLKIRGVMPVDQLLPPYPPVSVRHIFLKVSLNLLPFLVRASLTLAIVAVDVPQIIKGDKNDRFDITLVRITMLHLNPIVLKSLCKVVD